MARNTSLAVEHESREASDPRSRIVGQHRGRGPALDPVKHCLVGALERRSLGGIASGPAQPSYIEPEETSPVTGRNAERWNVARDHRVARDEGQLADSSKLVHRGVSAEIGAITYGYVTREADPICEDNPRTNARVMANVTVRHQQVVIAEARFATAVLGSAGDGRPFAKDVARPANQPMRRVRIGLPVLSRPTDDRE